MGILPCLFCRSKSSTKKNGSTKISASNQLPLAITSSSFDSEASKDVVIAAVHDRHHQQHGNAKMKKKWSPWKLLFGSNKLVINELLSQIDSLKQKQAKDQLAIMKMESTIEKFDQRIAELEIKHSEAVNNVVIVGEKKNSTSHKYDVISDSDDDDSSMSSD